MPAAQTKVYAILLTGFLVLCTTGFLFFTLVEQPSNQQLAGFYSLAFSEALSMILLALLERQRSHLAGAFAKAGMYSAIILYLIATALLAVPFISGGLADIKWLYAGQGVCLGILGISFIAIFTASKNVCRENDDALMAIESLKQLETRLSTLRIQNPEATWTDKAAQCEEEIRFSDSSCRVAADTLLHSCIVELEEILAERNQRDKKMELAAHRQLEKIAALIEQRNMESRNSLKGNF